MHGSVSGTVHKAPKAQLYQGLLGRIDLTSVSSGGRTKKCSRTWPMDRAPVFSPACGAQHVLPRSTLLLVCSLQAEPGLFSMQLVRGQLRHCYPKTLAAGQVCKKHTGSVPQAHGGARSQTKRTSSCMHGQWYSMVVNGRLGIISPESNR